MSGNRVTFVSSLLTVGLVVGAASFVTTNTAEPSRAAEADPGSILRVIPS